MLSSTITHSTVNYLMKYNYIMNLPIYNCQIKSNEIYKFINYKNILKHKLTNNI